MNKKQKLWTNKRYILCWIIWSVLLMLYLISRSMSDDLVDTESMDIGMSWSQTGKNIVQESTGSSIQFATPWSGWGISSNSPIEDIQVADESHSDSAICKITNKEEEVQWVSMDPLLKDGQTITVAMGYTQCHHLSRWDIAIYNYGGWLSKRNPLVKRVIGVAGDTFSITGGHIVINGKIAVNSIWEEYLIQNTRMLELYAHDYPVIPSGTILLMWDRVGGTIDGSMFGLASEKDILGKVIQW